MNNQNYNRSKFKNKKNYNRRHHDQKTNIDNTQNKFNLIVLLLFLIFFSLLISKTFIKDLMPSVPENIRVMLRFLQKNLENIFLTTFILFFFIIYFTLTGAGGEVRHKIKKIVTVEAFGPDMAGALGMDMKDILGVINDNKTSTGDQPSSGVDLGEIMKITDKAQNFSGGVKKQLEKALSIPMPGGDLPPIDSARISDNINDMIKEKTTPKLQPATRDESWDNLMRNGFCKSFNDLPEQESKCQGLSRDTIDSTPCCIWQSDTDQGGAGNHKGGIFSENHFLTDSYYYLGKCYGNNCEEN